MSYYVFLDIDGVLNTPKTWGNWAWGPDLKPPVEQKLVERLRDWVLFYEITVVISSSWRSVVPFEKFVEVLGDWLVCQTPRDWATPGGDKARAIANYVLDYGITDYVILDDEDMGKNWMEINYEVGLTDEDLSKASNILGIDKHISS